MRARQGRQRAEVRELKLAEESCLAIEATRFRSEIAHTLMPDAAGVLCEPRSWLERRDLAPMRGRESLAFAHGMLATFTRAAAGVASVRGKAVRTAT